jgi:hypothetical protein
VLPVHARRAWHLKKNRVSGLAMKLLLAWLAATGYALYYFATDANEAWLPLLHWVVGLAFPLLLVWHIRRGRARAIASQNEFARGVQDARPVPLGAEIEQTKRKQHVAS